MHLFPPIMLLVAIVVFFGMFRYFRLKMDRDAVLRYNSTTLPSFVLMAGLPNSFDSRSSLIGVWALLFTFSKVEKTWVLTDMLSQTYYPLEPLGAVADLCGITKDAIMAARGIANRPEFALDDQDLHYSFFVRGGICPVFLLNPSRDSLDYSFQWIPFERMSPYPNVFPVQVRVDELSFYKSLCFELSLNSSAPEGFVVSTLVNDFLRSLMTVRLPSAVRKC